VKKSKKPFGGVKCSEKVLSGERGSTTSKEGVCEREAGLRVPLEKKVPIDIEESEGGKIKKGGGPG